MSGQVLENETALTIAAVGPYDFGLSLRTANRFSPDPPRDDTVLRVAVRIREQPAVLALRQVRSAPPRLEVRTGLSGHESEVSRLAGRIVFAGLDLEPFYRTAEPHEVLGPVVRDLSGLKPMRPASLFEMLIVAVTEQQLSLAAAHRIRGRVVGRFGDAVDGLRAFPTPERLSRASLEDLMSCGLSRRKAEYVKGISREVVEGGLDLDRLETLPDEEVRSRLLRVRGLGPWSAEYVLVRGLGRPDRVPAHDLGIRSVVGDYLGRGERLSATGTRRKLSPFRPYRGLAAYYLLAHDRWSGRP